MINKSTFPNEDTLTKSDFWQAYKNWLALVEIISGPIILEGWRSHHQKMISDRHFSNWFSAWRAHDRLLRVCFMSKPFIIDTRSPAYREQFERCCTDFSILGDSNPPQAIPRPVGSFSPRPSSSIRRLPSPPPPSPSPSPRYAPYAKDCLPSSFCTSDAQTLCVRCGFWGHKASACNATISSHPEWAILVQWHGGQLVNRNAKHICLLYNVHGSCQGISAGFHGEHSCSLCGDAHHGACACTHN